MRSVVGICLLSLALPVLAADDAVVADEFRAFAKLEVERIRQAWEGGKGGVVQTHYEGLTIMFYAKILYHYVTLDSIPETYAIDVRKTDSIISPYVGVIEFPLVYLNTTVSVKGKKKLCRDKPLETCLAAGGRIVEKNSKRIPNTLEYEYVYQDNTWKPKKSFKAAIEAHIAMMNRTNPVQGNVYPEK